MPRQPRPVGAEPVSRGAPALTGPVMMNQDWRDLTMVHWAVPPERVRRMMPRGVRPDTVDGTTYVGLVPFRMVDAGLARGPGVPWAGTFLETNVRLYSVDATGRRGIVFLSLDTDRSVVVPALAWRSGCPTAGPGCGTVSGDVHTYDARLRPPWSAASSHVVVRAGAPRERTPLDDFLSARWGLHVRWGGRTLHVPNAHGPWPLRDAELLALDDGLLARWGWASWPAANPTRWPSATACTPSSASPPPPAGPGPDPRRQRRPGGSMLEPAADQLPTRRARSCRPPSCRWTTWCRGPPGRSGPGGAHRRVGRAHRASHQHLRVAGRPVRSTG